MMIEMRVSKERFERQAGECAEAAHDIGMSPQHAYRCPVHSSRECADATIKARVAKLPAESSLADFHRFTRYIHTTGAQTRGDGL